MRKIVGRRLCSVGIAVALLLTGCADEPDPEPDLGASGAFEGIPACDAPPDPTSKRYPTDLVLPPNTVVTSVSKQGPVFNINAFVPRTPVEIRKFYEGAPDMIIHLIEDEVFESEALITHGRKRFYMKATTLCARGSLFVAVVAPELQSENLPKPAGGLSPTTNPS